MLQHTDAWLGVLVGGLAGFFIRRARLCSFGAIESALIGGDWRRMKVFGLALGIALAGTQSLVLAGWLDPQSTTYAPDRMAWLGIAVGAFLFGFGMALVGTCALGSLVRLGGGDLRSLIVLMIFGSTAYAILRGALAPLRLSTVEQLALRMPEGRTALLTSLVPHASLIGLAVAAGLLVIAVVDKRLRKAPKMLTAGVVLGLSIVAGWIITAPGTDDFEIRTRMQSLTFVAPVARAFFGIMIATPGWFDFGVGTVFGVPLGSALAARIARDFHWEAFDDPLEMRRHISGAALMGVGGILAGGCTIGQGLTAGSLLALSWFFAVPPLILGAFVGIRVLVEGRPMFWSRLTQRR